MQPLAVDSVGTCVVAQRPSNSFHTSTTQLGQNEGPVPNRVSVVAPVAVVSIEAEHVIDEPPGRGHGPQLWVAACSVIQQSHRTRKHGIPGERAHARLSKGSA